MATELGGRKAAYTVAAAWATEARLSDGAVRAVAVVARCAAAQSAACEVWPAAAEASPVPGVPVGRDGTPAVASGAQFYAWAAELEAAVRCACSGRIRPRTLWRGS